MGATSYQSAFETARAKAGLAVRAYDGRHTFITRLAESPAVSEETIRQLAGHVSQKMLARYAHVRAQARRDAIATLEAVEKPVFGSGWAQNRAQSADAAEEQRSANPEKLLN
ncbi:MAG: tyrosine-type recombinase/integrase [Candidatus Binataceae bacterium]